MRIDWIPVCRPGGGEQVQAKLVQTFEVLTEFAEFDTAPPDAAAASRGKIEKPHQKNEGRAQDQAIAGLALTVNIQLQLPATSDGEVYDKLFGAMRKHLMGLTAPS